MTANEEDSTLADSVAKQEPELPDYLTSPNAISTDKDVEWRYGSPPDYSKTRRVWAETKQMNHAAGSLPELVENLVKNWEIEASFKLRLEDWRTIDHENYSFAMNGGQPQTGEHMLKVGTYNAIIPSNEYYSPEHLDFTASHKTFKRMMPTFAWEVMEVYSGPPKVAFKWRHWGEMKNDYVGFNDKGQKVVAKAHGGPIEIFGVTIANVDDKVRLQAVDTWMDPLDMFRQIAPHGIVNADPNGHQKTIAQSSNTLPDSEQIAGDQHGVDQDQPAIGPDHQGTNGVTQSQNLLDSLVCPFSRANMGNTAVVDPPEHTGQHEIAFHHDEAAGNATVNDIGIGGTQPTVATTVEENTDVPSGPSHVVESLDGTEIDRNELADGAGESNAHADVSNVHADVSKLHVDVSNDNAGASNADSDASNAQNDANTSSAQTHLDVEYAGPIDSAEADSDNEEYISSNVNQGQTGQSNNVNTEERLHSQAEIPRSIYCSGVTGQVGLTTELPNDELRSSSAAEEAQVTGELDRDDSVLARQLLQDGTTDEASPIEGEAVVLPEHWHVTAEAQQEMSTIKPGERESLMNQE